MNTQSLILKSYTGGRWLPLPRIQPGTVMVVTYDGEGRETFSRRPRFSERRGALRVDVVDVRPHRAAGELSLPAAGDVYHFTVRVDIQWWAADPAEVVRSHSANQGMAVLSAVDHMFRGHTRGHGPHDAQGAEHTLNTLVPEPMYLGAGLELTACRARVRIDERLVDRTLKHDGNAFDVEQDRHRLLQDKRRIKHLRKFVGGNVDAILLHLAQYPQDTASVLQQIVEAQERDRAARVELFEKLVGEGFILEADVAPLRERVLGLSTESTWAGRWAGVTNSPTTLHSSNGSMATDPQATTALLPLQTSPREEMQTADPASDTRSDGKSSGADDADKPE